MYYRDLGAIAIHGRLLDYHWTVKGLIFNAISVMGMSSELFPIMLCEEAIFLWIVFSAKLLSTERPVSLPTIGMVGSTGQRNMIYFM
jgi:hypothetical protein